MNQVETPAVTSPCIGYCQLSEASICLGCYRNISEITAWTAADEDEQKLMLAQAAKRKKQAEEETA